MLNKAHDKTTGTLLGKLCGANFPSDIGVIYSLETVFLAWITRQLPPSVFADRFPSYVAKSVRALAVSIKYPSHLMEDDIYASNLLAWVAYSSGSHETDAHVHFNGSMAMLALLLDPEYKKRCGEISPTLTTFGPFVIDCANAWAIRNGGTLMRCTTFAQRVQYFDELFLVNPAGAWYSGVLEAANATLGNLMEISLTTVLTLACSEEEEAFSRIGVEEVEQYIRAELGDVDLQVGLQTIFRSFQGDMINHTTVEGQLITRVFHRLRCVLLLLAILEGPSIQLGVFTQKAQYLAKVVINFCRKQSIQRDGPIKDHYLISWHNFSHLLLGGMALATDEYPERTFL